MSNLILIVEGPTERSFVQQHLAAHLARFGVRAWAVLPGRWGNQGGVRNWPVAREDILRVLRDGNDCTTMFDYYGLPPDWPGRMAAAKRHPSDRSGLIEAAVSAEIAHALEGAADCGQFVPYGQMHEFEALLFADVEALAAVAATITDSRPEPFQQHFRDIVEAAGGDPEAINDNYATCPSRRILAAVPRYRKVHHGSVIAGRTGLDMLRDRCRHFSAWVSRLEALGGSEDVGPGITGRVPARMGVR
jgi:hypothetical protein